MHHANAMGLDKVMRSLKNIEKLQVMMSTNQVKCL